MTGHSNDPPVVHLAIWDGLADGQDRPETERGTYVTDDECTIRWSHER